MLLSKYSSVKILMRAGWDIDNIAFNENPIFIIKVVLLILRKILKINYSLKKKDD